MMAEAYEGIGTDRWSGMSSFPATWLAQQQMCRPTASTGRSTVEHSCKQCFKSLFEQVCSLSPGGETALWCSSVTTCQCRCAAVRVQMCAVEQPARKQSFTTCMPCCNPRQVQHPVPELPEAPAWPALQEVCTDTLSPDPPQGVIM